MSAESVAPQDLDVWADPATERLFTPATVITFIRTVASVVLAGFAFEHESLKLLVIAVLVYWIGDSLDGQVARRMHHETRIGAVIDIMCDRFCAAAFYIGLIHIVPAFTIPVLIYLAEFMVIDCFLSIGFLHWRIRSPNYFYVIDRLVYVLNWSHPGKAVNSGAFAILLLVFHHFEADVAGAWIGGVLATALFVFKCWGLGKLMQIGLPLPDMPERVEAPPA